MAHANPHGPRAATDNYDQIPFVILCAFSAYIVTWYLQLNNRIEFLGAIRFEFVLAATLAALAFVTPRQHIEPRCNLFAYIGWFLIALSIEIPFSFDFETSWTTFVDRVVKFAFMAVFIMVFVRSPRALRFFIVAFMLAWLKLGEEGLVGEITGSLVWQNQGVMKLHGSTPLYAHPNSFSGFALGTLPFIYYLFPVAKRWQKMVLLVLLVLAINIILFTGSRTGYIGFLLFVVYVCLRSQQKVRFLVVGALIALIAVPLIPAQYVARFESITGTEAEGHSKETRIVILKDAAVIFSEHPFGVGVSAFPAARIQRFGREQDTHNLYMEVLTNLGIQGFTIWVLMLVAIFKNSRRLSLDLDRQLAALASKAPSDADSDLLQHVGDLKLMRAMLHAVAAYLVVRLAVGLFGMDLYEIYWWFAMGIVIAIHNMTQVAARITQRHLKLDSSSNLPATEPARPLEALV